MDDWNDLRLVLAISRSTTLTGAATALKINHSTAFRRLNALEEAAGVRLFERLPGGVYAPTAAGERMAAAAERVETEAAALDREIAGRDHRLTGRLRVTTSETLAFRLLTGQIARFHTAHPGITVVLVIDNRVLSLSRREADIALRVTRPREGDLYGRKLADIAWAVYAGKSLARKLPPLQGMRLNRLPLIGWLFLRRERSHWGRGFWIRPLLIELATGAGLALLYVWEIRGDLVPLRAAGFDDGEIVELLAFFVQHPNEELALDAAGLFYNHHRNPVIAEAALLSPHEQVRDIGTRLMDPYRGSPAAGGSRPGDPTGADVFADMLRKLGEESEHG